MVITKTFVFFNDMFPLCICGDFCLLPEWEDRVLEMKNYKGEL